MPRVGIQLLDEIHKISTELGHPGLEALWIAVKRRRLAVTKQQVKDYIQHKGEKQVLGAPQKAAGKTISEDDNRWMMDLIDVSNVPAGSWRFFLVCVNVFDRYMYARPLQTKANEEVADKLKEILDQRLSENRKKPQIISSDNGSEFVGGRVAALLQRRGIVQKFKDQGDLNALGLVDRQIGLLKRKLAEMHATTKKSWAVNLPAAVKALNDTPKPDVLHGAAPQEVREDPEVTFMLMQDQARAIQHNQKNVDRKKAALAESGGAFRPQVALGKFKRNFQATYGDPQQMRKVEAGRVTTTSGETFPLKQIKVVPVGAAKVDTASSTHARKMRDGGNHILMTLKEILQGEEKMSLTKAAEELRAELNFRARGRDYNELMKKIGGKLIDLIRGQPDQFKLITQPHGTKNWYYVSLA